MAVTSRDKKWTFDFEFYFYLKLCEDGEKDFGIQKYICSFDLCYFIKRCARKSYLNIDT